MGGGGACKLIFFAYFQFFNYGTNVDGMAIKCNVIGHFY